MTKTGLYPFFRQIIEKWIIRCRRGRITQRKLAKLAGVHEKHLSKIMNFRVNPRVSTIDKVERALDKEGL